MHALFIEHRTKRGLRSKAQSTWDRHMTAAIRDNPDHLLYVYAFTADEDVICAFQIYRSVEAANEFLLTEPYRAYVQEVAPHLEGPPRVTVLTPQWWKLPNSDGTSSFEVKF